MVAWGKGDGNPLPADTAQEIRSLYGKTTTADVIGTQPVYLLGMDRSVLTRSIANTAQKAFSKLNSTVVPKLADTVSSANFIQMLNAQSAALNSVAAGKQMTGEEVWALLIQNGAAGDRLIEAFYKDETGLSAKEASQSLSALHEATLAFADLYAAAGGKPGTALAAAAEIKKAEAKLAGMSAAQGIYAAAMLQNAKQAAAVSTNDLVMRDDPALAYAYDRAAAILAKWSGTFTNTAADGNFFSVAIKDGRLNIVGDIGNTNMRVTVEVLNPGFDEKSLLTLSEGEDLLAALTYIGQIDTHPGGVFAFGCQLPERQGAYTVRVYTDQAQDIYRTSVYYLPDSIKHDIVFGIQTAADSEAVLQVLRANVQALSKSSDLFRLLSSTEYAALASELFDQKQTLSGFDALIQVMDQLLVLKVAGSTADTSELEMLIYQYSHLLGINGTDAYHTYQSAYVTPEIKDLALGRLVHVTAADAAAWSTHFANAVILSAIEKTSYQDIMGVLLMNPSLHIDYTQYGTLTHAEKLEAQLKFAGRSYASLSEVKRAFEAAVQEVINARGAQSIKPGKPDSGGSVGAGGTGGGVSIDGGQAEQPAPVPEGCVFKDIDDVAWAKESILNLCKAGIVNGRETGRFEPFGQVTRAEFMKMLVLSLDLQDETAECAFEDVSSGDWFYPYVAAAQKMGLTTGKSETEFGAEEPVLREEIAVFLNRAMQLTAQTEESPSFLDADQISDYAADSVVRVQAAGLIQGDEANYFHPLDGANRAEAAVIMDRVMQTYQL